MNTQGIIYKGFRIEVNASSLNFSLVINGIKVDSCVNWMNSARLTDVLPNGELIDVIISRLGLTKAAVNIFISNMKVYEGAFTGLW